MCLSPSSAPPSSPVAGLHETLAGTLTYFLASKPRPESEYVTVVSLEEDETDTTYDCWHLQGVGKAWSSSDEEAGVAHPNSPSSPTSRHLNLEFSSQSKFESSSFYHGSSPTSSSLAQSRDWLPHPFAATWHGGLSKSVGNVSLFAWDSPVKLVSSTRKDWGQLADQRAGMRRSDSVCKPNPRFERSRSISPENFLERNIVFCDKCRARSTSVGISDFGRAASEVHWCKCELTSILPGRLSFATYQDEQAANAAQAAYPDLHIFTSFLHERYTPFCDEFGPVDVSVIYRFSAYMREKLAQPSLAGKHLVYYSDNSSMFRTNTAFLMGAFMVLEENTSPEDAAQAVSGMFMGALEPYKDSFFSPVNIGIRIVDILSALSRAVSSGLVEREAFSFEDYEFWGNPSTGYMHQITPKFIVMSGPLPTGQTSPSKHDADYYIDEFKRRGVTAVVRLDNKHSYDPAVFESAGFAHYDIFFQDSTCCSLADNNQLERFLDICENSEVLVVHCHDGLGKSPTLVAVWLIRHLGFTAREAISWLRVVRPGSIVGPQLHYLEYIEGCKWRGNRMLGGGDQDAWRRACCLSAMEHVFDGHVATAIVHRTQTKAFNLKSDVKLQHEQFMKDRKAGKKVKVVPLQPQKADSMKILLKSLGGLSPESEVSPPLQALTHRKSFTFDASELPTQWLKGPHQIVSHDKGSCVRNL